MNRQQLGELLLLFSVVSFGAAAYNVTNPGWYGYIALGLLFYSAHSLFR